MIIFDDYEYVTMLMDGKAPPCRYRNNVLRSCAKMVATEQYVAEDILNALHEYMPFDVTEKDLFDYVQDRAQTPPVRFHEVNFGLNELRNIYKLPRRNERKYYLAQLFCFKYFGTKRLRLAGREFKRVAGLNPTHSPLTYLHMGRYITTRREDMYGKVLNKYSNNKPYVYYYPKEKPGRTVFTYKYEGDCFMLPNIDWNSNMGQLWELCEEAKQYNL